MSAAQTPPEAGRDVSAMDSDIQPYSLHVSSRYLDLTRRKLELARMPREIAMSRDHKWTLGTPKETLEPLVDFWLNGYNWRAQESRFNALVPQYRTTVSYPRPAILDDTASTRSSAEGPQVSENDLEAGKSHALKPESLRIHFLHQRSESSTAIPLLYVHGWPGNVFEVSRCVESLVKPLDTPTQSSKETVAFHVVAPSIPGFGFSDSSTRAAFGVKDTADVLLGVMEKLGYDRFAVWGDGWGFKVARMLSMHHPSHILGVFTCHPTDLPAPQALKHKDAWLKYHLAKLTGARIPWLRFGYSSSDFQRPDLQTGASDSNSPKDPERRVEDIELAAARMTISSGANEQSAEVSMLGCRKFESLAVTARPQTLSFAVCDSPVGLLALIVDALRPTVLKPADHTALVAKQHSAPVPALGRSRSATVIQHPSVKPAMTPESASSFSATDILDWTMLYWLPGPEACLRWLLVAESEDVYQEYSSVPLGITWYGNASIAPASQQRPTSREASGTPSSAEPVPVTTYGSSPAAYFARTNVSPIWASAVQNLHWVKRRAEFLEAGIPAWERSSEAVLDVREFFGALRDEGLISR